MKNFGFQIIDDCQEKTEQQGDFLTDCLKNFNAAEMVGEYD